MINSVGDSILIDCDLFYTVRIRFFLLKLFHVKMSKRVKESGHQFRLKKKKRAEEAASLSGSLQRFFTTQSTSSGRSVSESISDRYDQNDLALESDGEFVDEVQTLQPSPSASTDIHESTSSNQISSGINIQIYDPNTWPSVLSNVLRDQIVKSGLDKKHSSKNKKYPVSSNGRSFNPNLFYSTLANENILKRDWLLYSDSSDSVYCFFCSLFNRNENAFCAIGRGHSDWRIIQRDASNHERYLKHHTAFKTWLDYSKRLI